MDALKNFFNSIVDIIVLLANNTESLKNCAIIFLNIVSGVSIIKGLGYLKMYKEKLATATFTFWSHFNIMLTQIRKDLENDYALINNLYDIRSRSSWENGISSNSSNVEQFYNQIKELLNYLKTTPDQMPAYKGWTDDFDNLKEFLTDAIEFDIRDSEKSFKFNGIYDINDRNEYVKNILSKMNNLLSGIERKQKNVESQIHKG